MSCSIGTYLYNKRYDCYFPEFYYFGIVDLARYWLMGSGSSSKSKYKLLVTPQKLRKTEEHGFAMYMEVHTLIIPSVSNIPAYAFNNSTITDLIMLCPKPTYTNNLQKIQNSSISNFYVPDDLVESYNTFLHSSMKKPKPLSQYNGKYKRMVMMLKTYGALDKTCLQEE